MITTEQVQDYITRSCRVAYGVEPSLESCLREACDAITLILNNDLTIEELREGICNQNTL